MSSRRNFLGGITALGAAIVAVLGSKVAAAQGTGVQKTGYVRPGSVGSWAPNKKYTNREKTPQTVHARIEARESGQSGTIMGMMFGPGTQFVPSTASVFWKDELKVPHASLCLTVPPDSSFQIKLEGNVPELNVAISVFQNG